MMHLVDRTSGTADQPGNAGVKVRGLASQLNHHVRYVSPLTSALTYSEDTAMSYKKIIDALNISYFKKQSEPNEYITSVVKQITGRVDQLADRLTHLTHLTNEIRDLTLTQQTFDLQRKHKNPLNNYGNKCFSQTDEDGITLEIIKRIGCIEHGVFAEFGVGNGTENNTLILKALGWKGFWIGGENLAFDIKQTDSNFCYLKEWITLDNIVLLAKKCQDKIAENSVDVVSLDLDGNDIYLVEQLLLNNFSPKLFIVEYNAKFIPPVKWQIEYNSENVWRGDDYFGASLASFVDLFAKYGFVLVCCNSHTGANAFFIKEQWLHLFDDVPKNIMDLYVSPRYYLFNSYGHPPSVRTIEKLFE
jgi:hypothetical protein